MVLFFYVSKYLERYSVTREGIQPYLQLIKAILCVQYVVQVFTQF